MLIDWLSAPSLIATIYFLWGVYFFSSFSACDENETDYSWHRRVRGIRANSSSLSHDELDASETLDEGDPDLFGQLLSDLRSSHPSHLNVFGGCCGTNVGHIRAIAKHIFWIDDVFDALILNTFCTIRIKVCILPKLTGNGVPFPMCANRYNPYFFCVYSLKNV